MEYTFCFNTCIGFYFCGMESLEAAFLVMHILMLYVAFPISYVIAALYTLIGLYFLKYLDFFLIFNDFLLVILFWLPYYFVGYFQWVVLLPKLTKLFFSMNKKL